MIPFISDWVRSELNMAAGTPQPQQPVEGAAAAAAPDADKELLAPISSVFMASWSWLKRQVKTAYYWTLDKVKAMGQWVANLAAVKQVTQWAVDGGNWLTSKVSSAHNSLREKSEIYTGICGGLNTAATLVKDGVSYAWAGIKFVVAHVPFVGLWTLNMIDSAYLTARTIVCGEEVESQETPDGGVVFTFTPKDTSKAAYKGIVLPAAKAHAPQWIDYSPMPGKLAAALNKALDKAGDAAAKASAAVVATVAAAVMITPAAAEPVVAVQEPTVSAVVAAPAVQEAQASVFNSIDAAVVAGPHDCVKFFEELHSSTERFLPFNAAWGTAANFYEGLITDPETKVCVKFVNGESHDAGVLSVGEVAKSFDADNRRIMIVATRLGLAVVFEEGDSGNYVYNAANELAASGALQVGGKNTLADLQYILGAEGKPNLGQHIEQLYGVLLNAKPSA